MTPHIPLRFIFVFALFAAVVGEVVMSFFSAYLWRRFYKVGKQAAVDLLGHEDGHRKNMREFTSYKGAIERFIYAAAPLLGVPEGIAVVLALNGISGLRLWSEDKGENAAVGRSAFNIWLSLHLLNVILGVGIALALKALYDSTLP